MPLGPQDHFYHAIGRLTIAWAYLETALDISLAAIHHRLGGNSIESVVPYALKRKITYLRKAFTKLPALAQWKDDFLAVADDITSASDKRHDLIHGHVQQHPTDNDATAKMIRYTRVENHHVPKPFEADATSVSEEVILVTGITDRLGRIVIQLAELLDQQSFQQDQ